MSQPLGRKIPLRTVRLSETEVTVLLDRLEKLKLKSTSRRRHARYRYRLAGCVIHIQQPGDSESKIFSAPTRDISARGVSFLHGGYVHLGAHCLVQLINLRGTWTDVRGEVAHCEYVGTGLYQVGVRFAHEIVPADFCEEAFVRSHRVLLVEDDPIISRLAIYLLKQLNAQVDHVTDAAAAVDRALTRPYELILMDIDVPGLDGVEAIRILRQRGHRGLIVAATSVDRAEDRDRCLQAGCDRHIAKPYAKQDLTHILQSLKQEPLFSTLEDDPAMTDLVQSFVDELPTRLGALENALRMHDYQQLRSLARNLRGDGASYGFEPISTLAGKVEQAVKSAPVEDALQQTLEDLVSLCLLVRSSGSPPAT